MSNLNTTKQIKSALLKLDADAQCYFKVFENERGHASSPLDANPDPNTESIDLSDDYSLPPDDTTNSGEIERQDSGEEKMQQNHDADSYEKKFHELAKPLLFRNPPFVE